MTWPLSTGTAPLPSVTTLCAAARLDDLAVDVGQPHVAAAEAVGQPLVVDAQEVQHRGVQVVDLAPCPRRRGSRTRRWRRRSCPPLTPPPASQMVKPKGLWSRPSVPWAIGVRPNSPPQTTSVSSSRPRAFRSFSRPAIGWSTARAFFSWPSLRLLCWSQRSAPTFGAEQLDEADAALDQAAGEQALAAEELGRGVLVVQAVERLRRRRLAREVQQVRARPPASGRPARSWRWPTPSWSSLPQASRRRRGRACASAPSLLRWSCRSALGAAGGWPPAWRRAEDRALVGRRAGSRC